MISGSNDFNYFLENRLTKLVNFVQFKRMLMFCLEDWGPWPPALPLGYAIDSSHCITIIKYQYDNTRRVACNLFYFHLLLGRPNSPLYGYCPSVRHFIWYANPKINRRRKTKIGGNISQCRRK